MENSIILLICVGFCIADIYVVVDTIRRAKKLDDIHYNDMLLKLSRLQSSVDTLMVDNNRNLSIRAFILREYGVQLSDNDIVTLLIEWNRQIETMDSFSNFTKKYLEEKKWLYR